MSQDDVPATVYIDQNVQRLLMNLLTNAIYHTAAGTIQVAINAASISFTLFLRLIVSMPLSLLYLAALPLSECLRVFISLSLFISLYSHHHQASLA